MPSSSRPANYLVELTNEQAVADFFEVPVTDPITGPAFEAQLLDAGILPEDAGQESYRHLLTPDAVRGGSVDAELSEYSFEYFGVRGLSAQDVHDRVREQGGYTPRQYLAYARVAFGAGRCVGARVGTRRCPVTVGDIQMSVFKNLDWIYNIRYTDGSYVKWFDTFALNREDIASRLVFDLIARKFAGLPHNPLRDIKIDVSNPKSWECRQLTGAFRNGQAFDAWLNGIPGMPPSIAQTAGHSVNGNSEAAANRVTGIVDTYHYGIFYFMEGLNCARYDPRNTCWPGEPLMAQYLVEERGVPLPREDGEFAWTCSQIATIFDVVASNPYKRPYDVLATEASWQFDPETYPLRDSPIDLTAEDVLLFMLAESNALPNMPGLQGNCNASQADTDAMFGSGLLNPEFDFQYLVLPKIYEMFLR